VAVMMVMPMAALDEHDLALLLMPAVVMTAVADLDHDLRSFGGSGGDGDAARNDNCARNWFEMTTSASYSGVSHARDTLSGIWFSTVQLNTTRRNMLRTRQVM
jgi:hypothetical protein